MGNRAIYVGMSRDLHTRLMRGEREHPMWSEVFYRYELGWRGRVRVWVWRVNWLGDEIKIKAVEYALKCKLRPPGDREPGVVTGYRKQQVWRERQPDLALTLGEAEHGDWKVPFVTEEKLAGVYVWMITRSDEFERVLEDAALVAIEYLNLGARRTDGPQREVRADQG